MFRQKSITYEVMVRVDGRWQIDSVKTTEASAKGHAENIMGTGPFDCVRIVQEEPGRKEKVVFEEACEAVGGTQVSISAIDYAPICANLEEVYGFDSRLWGGRLLRKYLEKERLTPLELVYKPGKLKSLSRNDKLMNQAIQKVAGLQAREFNADKNMRVDFLVNAVSEMIDASFSPSMIDKTLDALTKEGLPAASSTANKDPKGQHVLRAALAEYLSKSSEWKGKLANLLKIARGDGDEVILDEAVAEVLDGPQAAKEVLSQGDSLKGFLLNMIKVIQGKTEGQELTKLSQLIGSGLYQRTNDVLQRKIDTTLGHIQPLTKESSTADRAAFDEILNLSLMSAGLIGGAGFSDALTKRARITFAGDEDLSAQQAIDVVMEKLPNKAVKLGYLFDLARSPFVDKYLKEVGTALTNTLGTVAFLKDLTWPNESTQATHAAAQDLGRRLEKGGFPEDIGTLIAGDITKLLSGQGGAKKDKALSEAKAKTQAPKKQYKQVLSRMRLVPGEIVFNKGDSGDEAYLVDSGRIEILDNDGDEQARIGIVERGEIFGEMALIDQNGRSGTARAMEDTVLKIIPAESFTNRLDKLAASDIVLRRLIDVYVKRLRGRGR